MRADEGGDGDKNGETEGSGRAGGVSEEESEVGGWKGTEPDGGEKAGGGVGLEDADGEEVGGVREADGGRVPEGDRGNPGFVRNGQVGCGRGWR